MAKGAKFYGKHVKTKGFSVKGIQEIFKKLDKTDAKLAVRFQDSLKKAGLFIQRKSNETVPVGVTGNLKASSYCRDFGRGWKAVVMVGYTANYAIYVHEMIENKHGAAFNEAYADKIALARETKGKLGSKLRKYWFNRGENQRAKFLEYAIKENRNKILGIIEKGVGLKSGDTK